MPSPRLLVGKRWQRRFRTHRRDQSIEAEHWEARSVDHGDETERFEDRPATGSRHCHRCRSTPSGWRLSGSGEMAGGQMPRQHVDGCRGVLSTHGLDDRATSAESTTRGWIGGTWQLAPQRRLASPHADDGLRRRCYQRLRVGRALCPSTSATGPTSTMRPRYITATRLQRWSTTLRSWLMMMRVRPSCVRGSERRLRICARTETSKLETASSAISTWRAKRQRTGIFCAGACTRSGRCLPSR
jgi:hypothetical protein